MAVQLMKFFKKPKNELEKGGRQNSGISPDENEPVKVCHNCHRELPLSQIWGNNFCCEHCGHHFKMNGRQRINFFTDNESFIELFSDIRSEDFLKFPGYAKKTEATRNISGETEAVICGTAKVCGLDCAIFVMEPYFMMGSMGTAVGEKITRLFEYAIDEQLPVIGFCVSGGARMQEGILSLMQMAKTSGAVRKHSDAGLLYISILTNPTTGGVSASFATQGDIIFAEPGATIGFAGARVIEQTTRKKLPSGFQTAEFLLEHGFLDAIVSRDNQRKVVSSVLKLHSGGAFNG